MDLTRLAIDRDRVTLVLVALLIAAGFASYLSLPKARDPGFTIRTVVVTTRFPGASPERVEQLVTDKIEKRIQEMPEIDTIVSDSRTGVSIIYANFKERYTEMRPLFDDLRRKVEDVARELPDGANPPAVNDEFGDVFGSVYALQGEGFGYRELKDIADEIRDILLIEPDIAKVSIHGAQDEVVFVDYSNASLTELGISPQQLSQVLGSANILASGGNVVASGQRITLEPTGNLESVDALRRTVIEAPGGALVYLEDIAEVYRGYADPPASIARANGKPALVISVSLRAGGDILKLGERLDALVPGIEASYPWGVSVEKLWFQSALVEEIVDDFASNLMQAIGIVILVMIAFLGIRTGIVVATLIPSTIVITFFLMDVFSITINQVSLTALIIALGLLVDNAIVVVESIVVKRGAGTGPVEAAVETGRELRVPLLVSSLTTVAAFAPIALAESSVGEYTADIFYVVAIALLTSWMLAMTLIPMLSSIALKVGESTGDGFDGRWYRVYRALLSAALTHRAATLLITVAVFALAVAGLRFVPNVFIAPSEDPVLTATLEMPSGTSIERTAEVAAGIDRFLAGTYGEQGEGLVTRWVSFVGDGGPRFQLSLDPPKPNEANGFVIVNTTSGEAATEVIAGLQAHIFESYPDLSAKVARIENGPPVGYPIIVRVQGPSLDQISALAASVTETLYSTEGVVSVTNSWGLKTKKIVVDVDQSRALRAGVTSSDVAYSLRTSLSGLTLTEYREGSRVIPVSLRSEASDREDIDRIYSLSVYSASRGITVPLNQVANVSLAFETGLIQRRDRVRTLSLSVQLAPHITATDALIGLAPQLEGMARTWPTGYSFEIGGEAESSGDANASIAAKLPLAFMVILLLLVGQFNSIRRPLIVLSTIPLGMIGVTIGLLVARSSFGFFTILGIISLAGIIINNAIVLLDRIRIEQDKPGREPVEAVVTACLHRVRPILLTTATTVLGMLPLWWGGGAMFEPLAVAIIFGLAFASLLTLFVVPTLYAALFRVPAAALSG